MKQPPFLKGLSSLLVLNLLIKPVWIFLIDRQVQNLVGYDAYGQYFAVLNLSVIFSFLTDLGLTNMMNRSLAGKEGAQLSLLQLLRFKVLLSGAYSAAVGLTAWAAGLHRWDLLAMVVAIQVLTSFFLFFRNIFTAHQLFSTDAFLSVVDKSGMILICAPFLYLPFARESFDLHAFLSIQMGATGLANCIALFLLLRKKKLPSGGKKLSLQAAVSSTLPFTVIVLLMTAHYRQDGFLLERIHPEGAFQAGIYATAFRLLDAANTLGYMVASFLLPFMVRNAADHPLVEKTILAIRHLLLLASISVVLFTLFFAPWIQELLYHTGDPFNSRVMQLTVATLPAFFLGNIYTSVLTARGAYKTLIGILAVSAIANAGLNVLLIPAYGALACPVAALVTQYFCGVAALVYSSRQGRLSYAPKTFILYAVSAGAVSLLFYWGKRLEWNEWIVGALGGGATLLGMTLPFRSFKKTFVTLP